MGPGTCTWPDFLPDSHVTWLSGPGVHSANIDTGSGAAQSSLSDLRLYGSEPISQSWNTVLEVK